MQIAQIRWKVNPATQQGFSGKKTIQCQISRQAPGQDYWLCVLLIFITMMYYVVGFVATQVLGSCGACNAIELYNLIPLTWLI